MYFYVMLGPDNAAAVSSDYRLIGNSADGTELVNSEGGVDWDWVHVGRGRFLVGAIDGIVSWDIYYTATGVPWRQGIAMQSVRLADAVEHGGAAATFVTAAGVLAQESAAGAVETVAGAAETAGLNAQTAALRVMMQEYLSVERWTGLAATIDSGTLAVGQRITVYHAPNNAPSGDQVIAHIESDGSVTFDGIWTPPAELELVSVLKLEHDAQGTEIDEPIVITLTITSDEKPQNGSTVTVTIPGTNAAGDDRCWWVKPDGTLVRCNGGHIVPDARLNALSTDWTDGGRLDSLLDTAAAGGGGGGTGSPSGAKFFTTED